MLREVDLGLAREYLSIIAPAEHHFTFQTFDDQKRGVVAPRVFNGTIEQHADVLIEENRWGAGVFVTVNGTNLSGRSSGDIKVPQVLWIESDGNLTSGLPLLPSITSETSAGRHHFIFAVRDLTWDDFDRAMPALAQKFGGDVNAIDRARVLRLPGFFHRKREPRMVRIVDELTSSRSYSVKEIVNAFGLTNAIGPAAPSARRTRGRVAWNGSEADFEKVVSALRAIETACDEKGGSITLRTEGHEDELVDWSDRGWWLKAGFCLHHFFGGAERGYELWVAASGGDPSLGLTGCPEKFDPHDQRRTWEGFSTLPAAINVPPRWRTIRTVFWAADRCGWRQAGRPFSTPVLAGIHPSNDKVIEAGQAAVALGVEDVLQAHAEQAELRYRGKMLKFVRGLLDRVSLESGIGQVPALQTIARDLGTSEDTIRSYLKRLKAEHVIVKSNGTGRALKAKGIAYAFTSAIIATSGALCSGNASITTGVMEDGVPGYPGEVKTLLHADGGNGIEPWLTHVALPPVIVDRAKEAQAAAKAEKTLLRIAQELWHWHNSGMEHCELLREVDATYPDFVGIASGCARRRRRIKGAEALDVSALTASQYLNAFLRALGRRSLAKGLMTPEVERIHRGQRNLDEAKRAQIKRGALEYMIAKDPDFALHPMPEHPTDRIGPM